MGSFPSSWATRPPRSVRGQTRVAPQGIAGHPQPPQHPCRLDWCRNADSQYAGSGAKGIHWRLLIKHWDPELLSYSVPFQQSLISRLMSLDTSAGSWLMGVFWQFALPDESVCPPMPQRTWAVKPKIGPLVKTTAKGSLEQTFAARDAQFKQAAGDEEAKFQRTEPAPLS